MRAVHGISAIQFQVSKPQTRRNVLTWSRHQVTVFKGSPIGFLSGKI